MYPICLMMNSGFNNVEVFVEERIVRFYEETGKNRRDFSDYTGIPVHTLEEMTLMM